jgi:hypothetical protein
MTLQIIDCEQGTAEWLQARVGIPTASEFASVIADGGDDRGLPQAVIDSMVKNGCTAAQLASAMKAAKSRSAGAVRAKYMRQLAADTVRGFPEPETYTNAHMERGKVQEDDARKLYAFMTDAEPMQVGFMRNGRAGASPDSLIGEDGGLEIKTALGHIQVDRLKANKLPSEHRAQVQGNLWISGRAWWDFVSYSPGLRPLIVRVERDEAYIAAIAAAVEAFNVELDALVLSLGGSAALKAQLQASLEAA